MKKDEALASCQDIYSEIKDALLLSRRQAYNAVNSVMVQAYRQIGRIIVEHEQNGSLRAEYGKAILQNISERLQQEFGNGFTVRSLQQMKKFYVLFPNTNALRSQLTWTHYRGVIRKVQESRKAVAFLLGSSDFSSLYA